MAMVTIAAAMVTIATATAATAATAAMATIAEPKGISLSSGRWIKSYAGGTVQMASPHICVHDFSGVLMFLVWHHPG